MPQSLLPVKPNRRRKKTLAATILTLLLAIIYASSHASQLRLVATNVQGSQPGLYQVANVVDGDTIKVNSGGHIETVRLIGMDTPETHDPRKPVQCFGEAAHQKTLSLIGGKSVRLEADPADSDRDKYHRLLRYVYLPDGTFVNAELVRQGYAFAYTVFPNSKLDQFRTLEAEARQSGRGLWAGCNIDESTDIKQTTGQR